MRYKKKNLDTKSHTALSESIINKYCVKNPDLSGIVEKLRKTGR